jgi:two-component system, chemotaxis family, sensor histidine kinase and response regulator PixL
MPDSSILAKKTIMVVDDEISLRQLLTDRLQNDNYQVVSANSGLHAYQILKTGITIDLMVCDVNMPGLSGVQLVDKLNNDVTIKPFPVIMLTANRDREIVVRAAKGGVVDYLLKPFNYKDLLAKIDKNIQQDTAPE